MSIIIFLLIMIGNINTYTSYIKYWITGTSAILFSWKPRLLKGGMPCNDSGILSIVDGER